MLTPSEVAASKAARLRVNSCPSIPHRRGRRTGEDSTGANADSLSDSAREHSLVNSTAERNLLPHNNLGSPSPSRARVRIHAWCGEPLAGEPAPPASRFTAVGRLRFWGACRWPGGAGLRRPNVIPLVSGELGERPTATGPMRGRRSRRQALGDRGREPRAWLTDGDGASRHEASPTTLSSKLLWARLDAEDAFVGGPRQSSGPACPPTPDPRRTFAAHPLHAPIEAGDSTPARRTPRTQRSSVGSGMLLSARLSSTTTRIGSEAGTCSGVSHLPRTSASTSPRQAFRCGSRTVAISSR